MADSPDLVIAKLLLDQLKVCGFFERVGPGPDAALRGIRQRTDVSLMTPTNGRRHGT